MLRLALAMFLLAIVAGTLAYNQIEGWSLSDSFYIGESDIRRRFELLVVGRVDADGTVALNPAPTDTIESGSMLIVLGHRADLDRFAETIST